jgi:hypothetical protein
VARFDYWNPNTGRPDAVGGGAQRDLVAGITGLLATGAARVQLNAIRSDLAADRRGAWYQLGLNAQVAW